MESKELMELMESARYNTKATEIMLKKHLEHVNNRLQQQLEQVQKILTDNTLELSKKAEKIIHAVVWGNANLNLDDLTRYTRVYTVWEKVTETAEIINKGKGIPTE